jgi:hypothetical protein
MGSESFAASVRQGGLMLDVKQWVTTMNSTDSRASEIKEGLISREQ